MVYQCGKILQLNKIIWIKNNLMLSDFYNIPKILIASKF